MLSRDRHNNILQILEKKGSVMVSDLSKKFNVSIETIRRDLFYLESKNLLSRVHGGAILPSRMSSYLTLEERLEENVDKKSECAKTAMNLLHEDDVIFIDSGSTAVELARVLKNSFERMTVITHSLDVLNELRYKSGFKLISLGGEYNSKEAASFGYSTIEAIKALHASKAFIFPVAVSLKNGVADQGLIFISIQEAFMENSDETIFVADSSKFEKNSFAKLCDTVPEHIFITDAAISEEIYKAYQEKNIQIFRSPEDVEKRYKK